MSKARNTVGKEMGFTLMEWNSPLLAIAKPEEILRNQAGGIQMCRCLTGGYQGPTFKVEVSVMVLTSGRIVGRRRVAVGATAKARL